MTKSATSAVDLGEMPVWRLEDLYPSPDGPEISEALARAEREAEALARDCQGRLGGLARDGDQLAGAIARYEALQDLLGRIASFAFLRYAQESTEPQRAKFFGDIQERLTSIGTN